MKIKTMLLAPALLVSLLVFGGCATTSTPTTTTPLAASTTASDLSQDNFVAELETTLEDIYNRVNPSVVNINVIEKVTTPDMQIPGFSFSTPEEQYAQGLGSGFLWDDAGNIVTVSI